MCETYPKFASAVVQLRLVVLVTPRNRALDMTDRVRALPTGLFEWITCRMAY